MDGSRWAFAIATAAALAWSPALAAASRYSIKDLGASSQANGIARQGQIVGMAGLHAGTWRHGQWQDLGTLGGEYSDAIAVNSRGDVAGYATDANDRYCAFLYRDGAMHDIGSLGSDYAAAYAINDRGQIVGSSDTADGHSHAFLYDAGTMTDLGTLGGDEVGWSTTALGINQDGRIVGYSYVHDGGFHGFVYTHGEMHDLGTLGGGLSQAYAINARGDIAGQAYLPNADAHAVVWRNGRIHDLGAFNHYSSAYAINRAGTMVGEADVANDSGYLVYHAVIFESGTPVDLNRLIPPGSGWTLTTATSIDDRGRIVGYGQWHGQQHGFVLTPR